MISRVARSGLAALALCALGLAPVYARSLPWIVDESNLTSSGAPGGEALAFPFLDAHVHLNEPDSALALMDRAGVAGAIAFIGARGTNEDVLEAARRSRGRLIPFASISPERREYRQRWIDDDTTLVAELDQLLEGGEVRGIGEIAVAHFGGGGFPEADFDPTGPMMRGIMRVAELRRVPVLVHCEVTRLRELSELLRAFPRVQVIWAHGGYTPFVLAERMLQRHPNLTYELSARTWRRHPRSPDYTIFRNDSLVWPEWLTLIETHPTRFVVGTDASYRNMEYERRKIDRVRLLLSQLSDSARRLVGTENVGRLIEPGRGLRLRDAEGDGRRPSAGLEMG